jgi:hypothetical protein
MQRAKEGIPEEEDKFGVLREEGGIRGERLGLKNEIRAVSHRGESLMQ